MKIHKIFTNVLEFQYFSNEFISKLFEFHSEGINIALHACFAGPWQAIGSRYAEAVINDNTLKQRYRLRLCCGDGQTYNLSVMYWPFIFHHILKCEK